MHGVRDGDAAETSVAERIQTRAIVLADDGEGTAAEVTILKVFAFSVSWLLCY